MVTTLVCFLHFDARLGASRRGIAELYLDGQANGSRECAPDDKLRVPTMLVNQEMVARRLREKPRWSKSD